MLNSKLLRSLCAGLALSVFLTQAAMADAFDDLEIHGFVTQGYIKTSANSFFGDSENGSFDFTELGVNATIEPYKNVRLSGQLLSRRAGEISNGSPNVDFALIDLSVFYSDEEKLNLLFGRVKNPLGLYNESRDVSFTRRGIFLPHTVYFQNVRSLALSADGAALRYGRFSDLGNLEIQLGIGEPFIDESVEYAYLGTAYNGDFESNGLSWVGRAMVVSPDERWRFALSGAVTSLDFEPKHGDQMSEGNLDIVYAIASAQYEQESWDVSVEYVVEPIDYIGFEMTIAEGQSSTLEGYYAQFNWRFRNDLEFFLRYEEGYIDRSDKDGSEFEELTGLPSHIRYHESIVFGARWDVARDTMLRVEYQSINGTLILSNKENPDPYLTDRKWDMFSLSLSYRF